MNKNVKNVFLHLWL